MRIAILTQRFDPHTETEAFEKACGDFGALVTFVGRCRATSTLGAVRALELEHYPGFTERVIATFVREQLDRHAGADALVLHRVGNVAAGEAIVLVAATSPHRAAAFALVDTIMNFLKTNAPFWKREHTDIGSEWIEPTPADYARRTPEGSKS
jgi:molybdopterin synthase catalytic subunit